MIFSTQELNHPLVRVQHNNFSYFSVQSNKFIVAQNHRKGCSTYKFLIHRYFINHRNSTFSRWFIDSSRLLFQVYICSFYCRSSCSSSNYNHCGPNSWMYNFKLLVHYRQRTTASALITFFSHFQPSFAPCGIAICVLYRWDIFFDYRHGGTYIHLYFIRFGAKKTKLNESVALSLEVLYSTLTLPLDHFFQVILAPLISSRIQHRRKGGEKKKKGVNSGR